MRSLLLAICLFCSAAQATYRQIENSTEKLDRVVKDINIKLAPKDTSSTVGYEVDYRVDGEVVWVNILTVIMSCETKPRPTLKNGKIISATKPRCETHSPNSRKDILHQITCFRLNRAKCMTLLAEQLTSELVLEIVNKNIDTVEVEP
jgi:hypothetical protein